MRKPHIVVMPPGPTAKSTEEITATVNEARNPLVYDATSASEEALPGSTKNTSQLCANKGRSNVQKQGNQAQLKAFAAVAITPGKLKARQQAINAGKKHHFCNTLRHSQQW